MGIGSSFVENVYCALEQVQMPTLEREIGQFLAGEPPPSDGHVGVELEGEGENGDEGLEEGEEALGPPKSKKKKKKGEVKAQSVRQLHVSLSVN